jgi:N-acetylmuramoyl-L-alanine amidase
MKIHTIVIHYSATYPDQDIGVKEIRQWHTERGFRDVGYHWIIRRDGTLEEGRPEGTPGAHVRGHNSGTIGICWVGGLDRVSGPNVGVWNATAAQEDALVRLITDIQKRWPDAKRVIGHKDLVPTECPGLPRGGVAEWWGRKQNQDAKPKEKERTSFAQSTTVQASVTQVAAGAGTAITGASMLDGNAQLALIVLGAVIVLAGAWIFRERIRHWKEGVK